MSPVSPMHTRWVVRHHAKRHVADTPAGETEREWITRANRTLVRLSAALEAAVNPADLYELLTDFEELESLEAGTHPDLVRNEARTVDNTLDITERLAAQINRTIDGLLANTEPLTRTEAA